MATKASWRSENLAPGSETVKLGSTRVSVVSVATTASAAPAPSRLNLGSEWRMLPIRMESPTMPFTVIITAAKTVSLARVSVCPGLPSMSVTMSATSMTVTATASTSEPNGSPTRCATISAWCTAASTAPMSTAPTSR